jgi:serine/threonine-protein kinase
MTSSDEVTDGFLAVLREELSQTPYRPLAAIGAGGMGALYEVEHRTLKRRLAMKILRDPGRPDLEDRLRLEAQSLAQLSHPNLVQVVDYARASSGRPFLVCERLYGKTLKEALGPVGALEVELAVRYAIEALGGLHTAHRAGVVHRDVKLDNLFLCEGDDLRPAHVKVIDFGIAKLVGATIDGKAVDVAPLANPTEEGAMIGTPSFMSPEQITNQKVDHRADLYGMGVVLYRMLAGRNPFLCRDTMEYAMAHATEIPSPPSRFAELPRGLDALIMRALEKDPAHRFASAKEMIEALTPYASKATWPSSPTPTPAPTPAPALTPAPAPPHETASRGTVRMLESPLAMSPPQGLPRSTELLMEPPTLRDPRRHAPPPQMLPSGPVDATIVPSPRASPAWLTVGVPLGVALVALAAIVWFSLRLAGKV